MAGSPDPRPAKRVKDPKAARKAHLTYDECANPDCQFSGENFPLSIHHVLYGSDGRHDDKRNFLPLCGSGTTGCHGGMHHANPVVLAGIAKAIAARPDIISFVKDRLGVERGNDYLRRRYGLDIGLGFRPDPKPESKERKRR